jgi:hypothetical protein
LGYLSWVIEQHYRPPGAQRAFGGPFSTDSLSCDWYNLATGDCAARAKPNVSDATARHLPVKPRLRSIANLRHLFDAEQQLLAENLSHRAVVPGRRRGGAVCFLLIQHVSSPKQIVG